jgi:hypothetical protein
MKYVRVFLLCALVQTLTWFSASAQETVRITEFMALNNNGLDDEDGDEEDWIEIHNAGTTTVNLAGWYLTDTTNDLKKWTFPSVTIAPDGYLVVFASNKDRNSGELHTNFRLNDTGEYLALVRSNGVTIASEFYPVYPIQAPNISYGLRGTTAQEVLLAQGAPARALVPLSNALEPEPAPDPLRPWTLAGLDDSSWQSGTTGVGYENDVGYEGLLGLNVTGMSGVNETVYIRIPFVVNDPSIITALTLRMRYDDGFIAYLNGREVAWENSPDPSVATWTNGAPANRADTSAVVPTDFNVSAFIDFLHVGVNVLAIQGLNNGVSSSDLLLLPELVATVTGVGIEARRYFPLPTPGGPNNAGVEQIGPIVEAEEHHPAIPTDADSVQVTARIRPARGTVTSATLRYRIGYAAEVTLPFRDDGNSGDAGTNDLVYGAIIPASAHTPGQMVRWYITATDSFGGNSRLPSFVEPQNSPEYFGTVVWNASLTNPLPVLHWFIQNPGAADNDVGTRCSLFYEGEFYDNLGINLHGQSSRGFPKKSYDVDFHPGHNFKWKEGEPRADDINLLTTYPDKAHMRNMLAYETYRDAGNAYHWVVPVRVQQNGAFWGTAHIVENGDEDWLVRMGINSQGALYKMYNTFQSAGDATSGAEKKTRKNENNADLSAFQTGISLTGEARRRYMYDNVDVGQVVNFLAAQTLVANTDCCHKNYYFYRDTGFSGEWQMWPWDVDLSFGRRWIGSLTYWDQNMIANTELFVGNNNKVPAAIFNTPEMRQMYLRRLRTLMDEFLKPIGTAPQDLHFETRVDELAALISADAKLDAAKWNSHAWGNGSTAPNFPQTYEQAIADINQIYLPQRRVQLYNGLAPGASEIPSAQPPGTIITFGAIEVNPSSGNQDQEYIPLRNLNAFAVDISGWNLSGAISFTFRGGTVIPAGGTIYVAANRPAFRARTSGPSGNQALFITGDYEGRLSARGETLDLIDRQGVKVASVTTPSTPSAAQSFLRITELMYHPPILPGDTFDREEYEFIELKNIGGVQINLAGVHFIEGVLFNFTGSSVTALAAGARVLVVKNPAAFNQRYGAVAGIAGVYTGNLDNSGERIRLDDSTNEKILDFTYNNSWYPITDGRGFSLVIVDPAALFSTWDLKASWRPSGHEYGTPGADDVALPPSPGVLINEVLSHTDLPQKDAIELYNPTASSVNVTGWYLTDDPGTPKKFRIPARPAILAGGYLSFNEDDFNQTPGVPPSFSFSSMGDEAYLFSANAAGELTGYHHGYAFEASATGVPFGRYIDSQGTEHFVAMAALTLNAANSGPLVGPVVISEIHYHAPDKMEGAGFVDSFEEEYIELRNITGAAVPLFDPVNPVNTWRIRGGVEFNFPVNASIPANAQLLVVSFNPVINSAATAAFRGKFGLSPSVLLAGPFSGQISNEGDDIQLLRPDAPEGGSVPYISVDQVVYTDQPPWPTAADGFGPSLQRVTLPAFGNDPANWRAATTTPGAAYPGGNSPVITVHPPSLTVVANSNVTLSVTATGDEPLRYQWTFAGDPLPGKTNSTLLLPNVQPNQQGTYGAVVLNAAGSATTSNAFLTVLIPARIIQQPQSTQAHLGGSVIFVVQATSSSPLNYQWRKNGNILPGKTEAFLSVSGLTQNDAGTYDVVVSDALSSITSAPAQLTVLVNPVITSQPANLNVTVLGTPINVTLSVFAVSGTPLRYQWFFNGSPLVPSASIPSVTSSNLAINNVQLSHAGDYYVIVNDTFGSATSGTARLIVNTTAEYTQQPIGQVVPEGGTAFFSSAWSGSGPFLHRWRRTLPTAATIGIIGPTSGLTRLLLTNGYLTSSQTNSVLVFTNVGTNLSGSYGLVVSNAVGQGASAAATLTVIADTDRDGLPDSWETGRAGFAINDPSDALRDDDGDGMNNGREYFAGTDYLNPNSYLRANMQSSGALQLTFQAVSNRTYMVQYTDSLSPIQWVNLFIVPARSNTTSVTLTDPSPKPKRYHRIVTPAQP